MANSNAPIKLQGFIYVWVLALVAIMGIALAAVVEIDATMQRREQEEQLLAIGREFQGALRQYHDTVSPAGSHDYPEKLEELVVDARTGQVRHYLRKIYFDPLTGNNNWGFKQEGGRIVGVYSMAPGRPIKADGFPLDERHLAGAISYQAWVFSAY